MDATVTWDETGVRRPAVGGGCWEVHGRVVRAGAAPRVMGDEHLILVSGMPGARLRHQRRVMPLPPGEIVEVSAGEVVSVEMPRGCAFCAIQVQPSLFSSVARDLDSLRPFAQVAGAGPRLACCLAGEAAFREVQDAVTSRDGLKRFLTYALTTTAGRVRPAERSGHAVVLRIRNFLRQSYASTVTLEELGRMAGMCRFALARAFTREVGLPPHAYQTHVRVLRACELIREGTPLSAVALDVGFSDQSHLCRHFKRILGITPGVYAREVVRAGRARSFKPTLLAAA